jgi:hypothetical protein
MRGTGILVCTALLMAACVSPFTRDSDADKLVPRKAEPDFAPKVSSVDIGEHKTAPQPDKLPPGKAEQDLLSGISAYEDGDYKTAPRLMQSALDSGLLLNSDKVAAHKYLAFMHCAQRRDKSCREEFRKALELDPKFELDPAEEGHPIWGPVFKSTKAEIAKKPQK